MSATEALDGLRSRVLARFPLLFLQTPEERRWENELATLADELDRGLVSWTATAGLLPALNDRVDTRDPEALLKQIAEWPTDHLFLLHDFQPWLDDPRIVRQLRDLTDELARDRKTLLLMGTAYEVPVDLQRDSVVITLPLPGLEELRPALSAVLDELATSEGGTPGGRLRCTPEEEDRLLKAVLGLTLNQAASAWRRGLLGKDALDDDVFALLVSEKKSMIQGSDLLEFYELEEGVGDVGGLDELKEWLRQRAEAFGPRAREQGIPAPQGVLLLGVQGCGKSLTARATARLLSFPLVRLDASSLLGSERGSSEKNMREVLHLVETIAPAVLWLDEIEKGFAGSDGESGGDATMLRLVGRFLTWMSEQKADVFVVATANSVNNLPPEMLRRGRFDELFFIDLPNYHERLHIFSIHLKRRGWNPEKYDLESLASQTEGFSGAEIEQVIVAAMLDAFGHGGVLSQADLEASREQTVPLSVTMEEKVFELREWARPRCRPATPDSRVMQMLEEEQRSVEATPEAEQEVPRWVQLAEHGQLPGAVVELIRGQDSISFADLQRQLGEYVSVEGDLGLALKADPNTVLWVGLDPKLAEVLAKLINGRKLYCHPEPSAAAQPPDGTKLPQLDELPEERAEKPSWLPVVLRDLPPEDPEARLTRVARMKLSR
ncbi:MAG: AAA family ATPase [Planctomycetaceae bacterium]|nr:AAA family ATPase [Planctomycetaceae bacterium]